MVLHVYYFFLVCVWVVGVCTHTRYSNLYLPRHHELKITYLFLDEIVPKVTAGLKQFDFLYIVLEQKKLILSFKNNVRVSVFKSHVLI